MHAHKSIAHLVVAMAGVSVAGFAVEGPAQPPVAGHVPSPAEFAPLPKTGVWS